MSNHTPGPWFTAPSGDRKEAWGVYATAQDEYAEEGELTCLTDYVSKADAALIAAAPDLLEAVEAAHAVLRDIGGAADVSERIGAAIAKAKGAAQNGGKAQP